MTMAVERKGFRLTDLKLDYVPGDGEQHGDIDVSNLVFIAEGPSQLVPLTRLRSNHWIAKDNAAVSLSEETENVIAVLQGKELDDVANAILSQNELLEQAPARDQGGQGFSQKVEMEDFSLYTETGRWFLSWRNEVVDMGPSPTPVQPGQNFEEEHETQGFLDIAEVSFASLALYGSEKHTGLDEEAWYLTG
ncbi:hypothetical protein BKA70DRAFT_503546 [Coprinopsis sp. MPI-PUGE-AT-0042]|nr:hypothetical protein BKA70DRAFT_503546 [Coprinopsis sp. MPI-PUGE-AT-0042]